MNAFAPLFSKWRKNCDEATGNALKEVLTFHLVSIASSIPWFIIDHCISGQMATLVRWFNGCTHTLDHSVIRQLYLLRTLVAHADVWRQNAYEAILCQGYFTIDHDKSYPFHAVVIACLECGKALSCRHQSN